ncbi:MAG: AAA family ATPase [Synergistaceae bacterium]|jgi:DNA replication and repair protein RecF|nr:AAA family ATPase [Synergistaceae bacterium]
MYFKTTYFHNFRNLRGERREWVSGFNLITGPNGSGKTNFLEGLNLISGWGPFDRKVKIPQLVRRFPSDHDKTGAASLWGMACGEDESEVFASLQVRCQLKCDDKSIGASEMRRKIPMLSFMPGHMSLLKGGASCRRQLLDMIGAVVSVQYARILHDYRHLLRQKSALLRKMRSAEVTDRMMIAFGSWLWSAREEILSLLKSEMENFSQLLPAPLDFFLKRGGGTSDDSPVGDFKRSLQIVREKEIFSRMPLVGPHRDDIIFTSEGVETSVAFSRGQNRRAVSAIILASAHVVEQKLGKKPVLVFDEITSELDEQGRELAIEALLDTGYQVFAATADALPHEGVEIHKMRDGRFL